MRLELTHSEVNDYLRLIAIKRESPSVEFLRKIIRHTLEVIPFQNITMLDSERRVPTEEEIKQLMLSGIGGICTIRNPFIHKLLIELGFDARLVSSTIMNPDCHITIIVAIGNDLWWCDPGNGFPYFDVIRLGDEKVHSHPFLDYRLTKSENKWKLQHKNKQCEWFTNYHFHLSFVNLEFFEEMYFKHYTDPSYGPFLNGLRFNKWTEHGGIILRDETATDSNGSVRLSNEQEFCEWVDKNSSPLNMNDLFGTRKNTSEIWSVIG